MLCGDDAPVLLNKAISACRSSATLPGSRKTTSLVLRLDQGCRRPASLAQVKKFTNAIKEEMKKRTFAGMKLGVDFIDINMLKVFAEEKIDWTDGMTPMMEARAIKNEDEQEALRMVARSATRRTGSS